MRTFILISFSILFSLLINAQANMPLDTIQDQFEKVRNICDKDNGKLWGKNLYGPILVVDKKSKMIVANQQDEEGKLIKKGEVYVGKYPENTIVAATAIEYAGKLWAMIPYLSGGTGTFDIYKHYIHESFHRTQEELGINCKDYDNSHMDMMEARLSINMEWQALLNAISASNEAQQDQSIKDALLFRQYRRQLFPGADSMENRFEIHEGLADYTAFKLCCHSKSELKENILQRKSMFLNKENSYVRTFGYYSGLLYAYLLDEKATAWHTELTCEDDLGLLLQQQREMDIFKDTAHWWDQVKSRYPYQETYLLESEIQSKKEERLSTYRIRFTRDPVLIIDLISPGYGIYSSPYPLDTIGSVYPLIDISDQWGYLKVTDKGCLIAAKKAIITADSLAIEGQQVSGTGWELKLNEPWTIVKQNDNYLIKKK